MNRIPLRTAVIAGTCAIALSFVAVPAFADVSMDSSTTSAAPADSVAPTPADSDDSGSMTSDDGTADDSDGTTVDDPSDDQSDDMGDVASDDGDATDPAPSPTATAAPLPAEQGMPSQKVHDAALSPREVVKKGIRIDYRGLTPRAEYQPFYSTGQSGGAIDGTLTADSKGRIRFTWHPAKSLSSPFAKAGAEYTLGLMGTDTVLTLRAPISVGYDSDLVWAPAERHGGTVTLQVRADHAKATGTKDVAWKKVRVEFQKKVGTRWETVTTAKTDAHGVATVTFVSGKHVWRAVIDSSTKVFGSTTKGHRK